MIPGAEVPSGHPCSSQIVDSMRRQIRGCQLVSRWLTACSTHASHLPFSLAALHYGSGSQSLLHLAAVH